MYVLSYNIIVNYVLISEQTDSKYSNLFFDYILQ